MNPFDYVNSILHSKKNLIEDEASEKGYVPFLTNRSLSYHKDAIFYAQEMNLASHIDKKLQFQYFINTIRPMKRNKVKWSKKEESVDIDAVMEYYGYSYQKAKSAVSVLSKEQLKHIRKRLEKGGTK